MFIFALKYLLLECPLTHALPRLACRVTCWPQFTTSSMVFDEKSPTLYVV